jgi:lysophospholipase L1-like esterase
MAIKIFLVILFVAVLIFMAYAKAGTRKVLVFLGDSITAYGAEKNGYVAIIHQLMQAQETATKYNIINAGVPGNKITDAYLRLEKDVIDHKPYICVIFIGVNDVWHKQLNGTGTTLTTFENFYKRIIEKLQYANCKIILCTPAVIGEMPNGLNALDDDVNAVAAIIRNLSKAYNLPLVDIRNIFLAYYNTQEQQLPNGIFTTDGVHLNNEGNRLVAASIWQEIIKVK